MKNAQIIYNVTVNIDSTIKSVWLRWIKQHILEVLATDHFIEAKLSRVLVNEAEGFTYSIQYKAHNRAALNTYYNNHAERLRQDGLRRFGDKMLSFRTELEIIDEFLVKIN